MVLIYHLKEPTFFTLTTMFCDNNKKACSNKSNFAMQFNHPKTSAWQYFLENFQLLSSPPKTFTVNLKLDGWFFYAKEKFSMLINREMFCWPGRGKKEPINHHSTH